MKPVSQKMGEEPMRRTILTFALVLLGVLMLAPAAQGYGLEDLDLTLTNEDGSPNTQAGSHPFGMTTKVGITTETFLGEEGGEEVELEAPEGETKDVTVWLPPGIAGNQTAVPQCSGVDFAIINKSTSQPACSSDSALGIVGVRAETGPINPTNEGLEPGVYHYSPVYNLVPSPGVAAKLGFLVFNVPITVDVVLNESPPYNLVAKLRNISQFALLFSSELTVWGNPADHAHDSLRGHCLDAIKSTGKLVSLGQCPVTGDSGTPLLTQPRSCQGPLVTAFAATSWLGESAEGSVFTHDGADPPNLQGITGCSGLGFAPSIGAQPSSKAASSPSGLDFSLDVTDEGLGNPTGRAESDIRKTVVTLPEGMSANPSIAEGLNVCTESQLAKETAFSLPGAGCPDASKIGTVEVETQLLEGRLLRGSLFIAKPYENPFDSLLALYVVIKEPEMGIMVRQPLKVIPDPVTGQLTTVAEDMPELPFSHFRLHFREGARSPLTTPQACGTHNVEATLYPWSGDPPLTTTSTFQIITGPNEGPCPSGGLPPFKPGLLAGTINNRAGGFSPFNLRMFRSDSEQEITRFSIKLPPGITGKLAGIPYCPDAAIAAAKARTGPLGGHEELASPSCPAGSEIGRTLAGAGVGPSLTYAPGKVYLAGPYNGSKLSMVAITAGVVGPFDIGTVVIREAFQINPETAEVFIDSTGSDPIPHIINGIPVHLRDIRAYVDKPDFVLNPTDCTRTSTASTVLGAGLDFSSEADDRPVTVTSPFQAADCAALPFKPQLSFRLIGGTKRGAHPAFKAHLQMNGIGESGIASAQVTLPKSEFIENAHFDTICTRVQFKAGAGNGAECPPGSIYGKAKAVTPILGEPLEGPVFLRSSEHQLPDLVIALHNSQVDFNLIGRVDSVDGKLRNTFETAPDAPVSSFDIELAGGKKGLFVNSTNLCAKKRYATAAFTGQNGKAYTSKPVMAVKCKKAKKSKAAKRKHRLQLKIAHAHRAGR